MYNFIAIDILKVTAPRSCLLLWLDDYSDKHWSVSLLMRPRWGVALRHQTPRVGVGTQVLTGKDHWHTTPSNTATIPGHRPGEIRVSFYHFSIAKAHHSREADLKPERERARVLDWLSEIIDNEDPRTYYYNRLMRFDIYSMVWRPRGTGTTSSRGDGGHRDFGWEPLASSLSYGLFCQYPILWDSRLFSKLFHRRVWKFFTALASRPDSTVTNVPYIERDRHVIINCQCHGVSSRLTRRLGTKSCKTPKISKVIEGQNPDWITLLQITRSQREVLAKAGSCWKFHISAFFSCWSSSVSLPVTSVWASKDPATIDFLPDPTHISPAETWWKDMIIFFQDSFLLYENFIERENLHVTL